MLGYFFEFLSEFFIEFVVWIDERVVIIYASINFSEHRILLMVNIFSGRRGSCLGENIAANVYRTVKNSRLYILPYPV